MSIIIRPATPDKFEIIARLQTASWKSAYRGLLTDEYLDNLDRDRSEYWKVKQSSLTAKDFVLIAEDNERMVGFIAVMDKPNNQLDMLIDNLHVIPDMKRAGIGSRLMQAAAEQMKSNGVRSTYLWVITGNKSAIKFYLAKKGVPEDLEIHLIGGKHVEAQRFVWRNLDLLIDRMLQKP